MSDGAPTLEVGFAIDPGSSFADLAKLDDLIGKTAADAVKEFEKVEKASGGMLNLSGATAAVSSFGAAATREGQNAARAMAQAEKAGEALSRQLDRQTATFGKTREEIRAMKVETAALAAEQQGLTELAGRLRDQQAGLAAAEQAAADAAAAEAARIREAAVAHQLFENAVWAGAAALKEQAAVDAAAAAQKQALAIQAAAQAHAMFEARVRAGAAALKEEEAEQQRNIDLVARLRAMLDPAAAAQQRLTDAIEQARAAMRAVGADEEELARVEEMLANQARGVGNAHQGASIQMMMLHSAVLRTFDSVSAGQHWSTILVQQGNEVVAALGMGAGGMGGKLAAVGEFMSGPWGLVVMATVGVLGMLGEKFLETGKNAESADKALEAFAKRQGDISNFIDHATGALVEQNKVLRENAILTRQAQIDKNNKDRADLQKRFTGVVDAAAKNGSTFVAERQPTAPTFDPAIIKILQDANGDVQKISQGLTGLYRTRPDLRATIKAASDLAGQMVLIDRNSADARKEIDELGGAAKATGAKSAELIAKQVALATATTPLERARAQLAIVQERAAAADKGGAVALEQYRKDLTAATEAVHAAEAAQKAQAQSKRDATKAEREAEAAAKKAAATTKALANDAANTAFKQGVALQDQIDKWGELVVAQDDVKKIDISTWMGRTTETLNNYLEHHGALSTMNDEIERQKNLWEQIDKSVSETASHMRDAFGDVGATIGDALKVLSDFAKRQKDLNTQRALAGNDQKKLGAIEKQSIDNQLNGMIGLTGAAKNLFSEHSKGYKAMAAAEKALTIIQLARTAVDVAGGAARMFAALGPFAFPAVAAMVGVMAALGFSSSPNISKEDFTKGNTGTGTVLGDPDAKSASIKNAIDALKGVDDATLTVSRNMLTSLRSIESNIGGLASLLVRTGNINADNQVSTGFKAALSPTAVTAILGGGIGLALSKVPIIGGIINGIAGVISSLFGTKTSIIGNGLYGGDQSISSILQNGYDLQTYTDVQKKKKFLGLTTSTKYSTVYGQADSSIDNQFTLILKSFYTAIGQAAGPLGQATSAVEQRLNSFVFSLGKINIQGLSGEEIQQKLEDALGAAADQMAETGVPGLEKFQKVGEGYFETLVRVASTVEQVDAEFQKLGKTTGGMGVEVDMAIANMFDNVSDFTNLADQFFDNFYSPAEKAAAETAQLTRALGSLGLALPDTLGGFRALVEAQDLSTDAGRQTYVALLQLAPAFSNLKTSLEGVKSAADILSERQGLEQQLLELQGDTAAIRQAALDKLDVSNRALQEQIYALQDAQDAAKAAQDLKDAWKSVGDSIMDEVKRIRGLTDTASGGSFASLLGQFNAATASARAGDQDAAKLLPGLSQSLLTAAADAATSRQELARVQAQTAASLEQTYGLITALAGGSAAPSTADVLSAAAASSPSSSAAANDDLLSEISALRDEVAQLRADNNAANATIAGNTGAVKKTLDNVTAGSGGTAISVGA